MTQNDYGWQHDRRYNSYSDYFRKHFGFRVQKVSVDAGFTCPNRDGTKGIGGCTFCDNNAFNPSYCEPHKTINRQISEGIEFHKVRYRRAQSYLIYFQAYSNTYAPLTELRRIYSEALTYPGIAGLVIGTRPDCIDEAKLDYFGELALDHYIMIEYGIESCYDTTLRTINRGHTYAEAADAVEKTAARGIKTGAHIIFGLPGETEEQMLAEAGILSKLPLNNIKFHQLQIIKGTAMAAQYAIDPSGFKLFSLDEYIRFIIRFAERLHPDFVIERFTSEAPPRYQAGPTWGNMRTDQVQRLIEQEFERQDTWQGKYFEI